MCFMCMTSSDEKDKALNIEKSTEVQITSTIEERIM